MENEYIHQFKQERDLGSILNDTFAFIRDEWRDILDKTWKLILPFFLMIIIANIYFIYSFGNSFSNTSILGTSSFLTGYLQGFGLFMIATIVFYVFIELTIFYYIKLYIDNEGDVDEQELKSLVFKGFFPLIFLHFIILIPIYIGFMFLLIPGIFLSIVLIFAPFIYVFEEQSIGSSFSKSFDLIKDNWWATFGTLIVISIVFSIMGYIFSLPAVIYQFASPFTSDIETITDLGGLFKNPIFLFLNLIATIGKYIISTFSLIAVVFTYFDLYEQKYFTGTYDKIDDIGSEY